MSIEKLLQEHIEALNANTAALEALVKQGGGAAPTKTTSKESAPDKTSKTSEKSGKTSKGKVTTQDEMTAALLKLKDDFGLPHAKKVMKKYGFEKMAEVTEEFYDKVKVDAVKLYEKLSEESGEEEEGSDDGI